MDYASLILLLLVVAYYIGAPTLVYVSQKIAANPVLQPLALSIFTPDVIQYFIQNRERLAAEGFTPLGEYRLSGADPDRMTALAPLVHPETGDRALIVVLLLRYKNDLWRPLLQYVEIEARFEDGSQVSVSNSAEPRWFRASRQQTVLRFEVAQDARALYRLHRRAVAQFAPPAPVVFWPLETETAAPLAREFRDEYERQRREKALYLDPERGIYRPTLRGAFLLTWRTLFPFRILCLLQERLRIASLRDRLTESVV